MSLLSDLMGAQAQANKANEQRYQQAMSIYDDIISRSGKGGAFEKASLADIEKQKTKGVGGAQQQMISSGLYGTSTAANLGKMWESDVAGPQRLRLEDIMEQRRTSAMRDKAGFIERREDVGPGYETIASLAQSYGRAQPTQPRQIIRDYGGRTTFGASGFKGSGLLYPTKI